MTDITDEKYEEFWNFVILWNLFESRFFERNFKTSDIDEAFKQVNIPKSAIEAAFLYIKNNYINKMDEPNERFSKLGFRNLSKDKNKETQDEILVKSILKDSNATLEEKKKAIIIVIYRYRNNFFHGVKDIASLTLQKDRFEFANEFLKAALQAYNPHNNITI